MRIILMGLPGAGKGTQSKRLAPLLSVPHISTGDILRKAIANDTKLGRIAKEKTERGEFLDDQFTINFVSERLKEADCEDGFILDGFPRTLPQAQGYHDFDTAILLEISHELSIARAVGRLSGADGQIYHERLKPPPPGLEVSRRKDDTEAMAERRIVIFEEKTRPVFDYYQGLGKLIRIPGDVGEVNVTARILQALKD
ncbi:MAG: nucleoside monophosphate kinase [Planctomycetota bacterium]|nr:nucleoside monophosphate kinase [Planctomycetota bacterium]